MPTEPDPLPAAAASHGYGTRRGRDRQPAAPSSPSTGERITRARAPGGVHDAGQAAVAEVITILLSGPTVRLRQLNREYRDHGPAPPTCFPSRIGRADSRRDVLHVGDIALSMETGCRGRRPHPRAQLIWRRWWTGWWPTGFSTCWGTITRWMTARCWRFRARILAAASSQGGATGERRWRGRSSGRRSCSCCLRPRESGVRFAVLRAGAGGPAAHSASLTRASAAISVPEHLLPHSLGGFGHALQCWGCSYRLPAGRGAAWLAWASAASPDAAPRWDPAPRRGRRGWPCVGGRPDPCPFSLAAIPAGGRG